MDLCFQVNEGVPMAGRWASAQPYAGSGGERPPRVRHEDNLKVVDGRGQLLFLIASSGLIHLIYDLILLQFNLMIYKNYHNMRSKL